MHLAIIAVFISGLQSLVPGTVTNSPNRLRKRTFPAKGKSNTGFNATGTAPMQPRLQSRETPAIPFAYAVPHTQNPLRSRFSQLMSNRLRPPMPKAAIPIPVATPIFDDDALLQSIRPTSSSVPKVAKSGSTFPGSSQARLPKSARRPNTPAQGTRLYRTNQRQSNATTSGSNVYQSCSDNRLIGKVLKSQYRIDRYLGKTGNRIFFSASYNGERVAIECSTSSTPEQLESLIYEVISQEIINHENILKVKEAFLQFGLCFKVTEHWELDLPQLVEIFNPDFDGIKSIMLQVLEGVIYLNGLNEAHRNLHTASVKIKSADDHTIKIADMGAPIWRGDFYDGSHVVGERGYKSPELLSRQMGHFWIKNDVWALGIMVFKLMTKTLPWGDITDWDSITSIVNNFQRDYGFSDDKVEFFRRLFVEADSRPTASDMKQMLLQLD